MSCPTMVWVSFSLLACLMISVIVLAQNPCLLEIFSISSTKESSNEVDSNSFPKGSGTTVGRAMKTISVVAFSLGFFDGVSLEGGFWTKLLGDDIERLDGKAGSDFVAVDFW